MTDTNLPREVKTLVYTSWEPHISLSEAPDMNWRDLGQFATRAMRASDYGLEDNEGWSYSPSANMFRRRIGGLTSATPAMHELPQ